MTSIRGRRFFIKYYTKYTVSHGYAVRSIVCSLMMALGRKPASLTRRLGLRWERQLLPDGTTELSWREGHTVQCPPVFLQLWVRRGRGVGSRSLIISWHILMTLWGSSLSLCFCAVGHQAVMLCQNTLRRVVIKGLQRLWRQVSLFKCLQEKKSCF